MGSSVGGDGGIEEKKREKEFMDMNNSMVMQGQGRRKTVWGDKW